MSDTKNWEPLKDYKAECDEVLLGRGRAQGIPVDTSGSREALLAGMQELQRSVREASDE